MVGVVRAAVVDATLAGLIGHRTVGPHGRQQPPSRGSVRRDGLFHATEDERLDWHSNVTDCRVVE